MSDAIWKAQGIDTKILLGHKTDKMADLYNDPRDIHAVAVDARVCSQLSQPDESASEMKERQEGLGEHVVTRGDAFELLDAVEETLDQIATSSPSPSCRSFISLALSSGWLN